ncbi:hypothetical protein Gasu2_33430 [Galdieria sulphuraria]|nr:hypothetical protein Gasu2_33430 [Galdieria sulphuraria]
MIHAENSNNAQVDCFDYCSGIVSPEEYGYGSELCNFHSLIGPPGDTANGVNTLVDMIQSCLNLETCITTDEFYYPLNFPGPSNESYAALGIACAAFLGVVVEAIVFAVLYFNPKKKGNDYRVVNSNQYEASAPFPPSSNPNPQHF